MTSSQRPSQLRRALYAARGQAPPEGALAVDGPVAGALTTYSHWPDAPPAPTEIDADTSTQMLLRAALDEARWLAPYPVVCNNHVDADGLLSLLVACSPSLALSHGDLLIGAAEAGDLRTWPGEDAFRLMLRIHQLIRDARQEGGQWEQRCCDAVGSAAAAAALIAQAAEPEPERDAALAAVQTAIARLEQHDGFRRSGDGLLQLVAWRARSGHPGDAFTRVHLADDAPPWALSAVLPERACQLLAMEVDGGIAYQLDAPRWSWARTVRRQRLAWPDLARTAARLQELERGPCRWHATRSCPDGSGLAFTMLMASMHDGALAPSTLPPDLVESACRAALVGAAPATLLN